MFYKASYGHMDAYSPPLGQEIGDQVTFITFICFRSLRLNLLTTSYIYYRARAVGSINRYFVHLFHYYWHWWKSQFYSTSTCCSFHMCIIMHEIRKSPQSKNHFIWPIINNVITGKPQFSKIYLKQSNVEFPFGNSPS